MKSPSRTEQLRQLHTRLGGRATLVELARAAIAENIFPANIPRDKALAACRRALTESSSDVLPFAVAAPGRTADAG